MHLRTPTGLLIAVLAVGAANAQPEITACSDFDGFVNGRWNATTEVPATRARIGSFDVLRIDSDRLLGAALPELVADPARQTSPGLRLLAAYYASGMDEAGIESRGLAVWRPLLDRVDALATHEQLPALLGSLIRLQIGTPVALFVGIDAKDATRHVVSLQQSGLGLPDREDYTRADEHAQRVRDAYRRYAAVVLGAAGVSVDDTTLDRVMALEAELAKAQLPRVQRRDPYAQYNPMDLARLQSTAPGLDWAALVAGYAGQPGGVGSLPLVVGQPAYLQALARLVPTVPLDTWRSYLRLRVLDAGADHGPRALRDAHFAYYRGAISGLKSQPKRSDQVILAIGGPRGDAPLGLALGELFVAKSFSPLAQQRARQMLEDIRAAMRQRIATLDWMSPPTRVKAQAKLDAMVAKIGAPERWRSYEGLSLLPDDFAGNLLRTAEWNTQQRLADLSKPVDRQRWTTSPHIVNAFAASGNQIVFPAAILQPPFFDPQADDASNYGGIGMVIGHEITHHFDDRGRQFDSLGNLQDWWAPQDAEAYKARAARVAQLYGGFEPVPGVRINGQLTLGENLSDFGGLAMAYDALQIALQRQRAASTPIPAIEGQTPEQRFFTANAIIWRSKTRIEALVDQLRTDGHSPGRWRVLAPMSHLPAFAQAFGCKAGDAMVAAEPIRVW